MLVPVTEADGILLDLRYATANILGGVPIYRRAVALLHPAARDRLLAAAGRAAALGLRLKLLDAFRPLDAQWAFWRVLPDPRFVADPSQGDGGMHPRGVAVDLTLADAADGAELPMGTDFDEMTQRSAHDAMDLDPEAIRNRALLLGIMAATGWEHIASEWWHYQVPGMQSLPPLWAKDVPDGPM